MSEVEETVEEFFDAHEMLYENMEVDSETGEISYSMTDDDWDRVEDSSESIWDIDVRDLEEAVGYTLREVGERYLIS